MPMVTVKLVPGFDSQRTPTLLEAQFSSGNLVRFAPSGIVQKLGGWARFYPTPIASTVTAMHAWEDLEGVLHLAVGATGELDVITGGVLTNITPQTTTTNPAVNFSTASTSNIVTIFDAGSNTTIYDVIVLETQVSVGGLVLFGTYAIVNVVSSDAYQIDASSNATSTVNNAGAVPIFTAIQGLSTVTVNLANHGLSVGGTFTIADPTVVGGLTLAGFYTVTKVIDANNFVITATATATSGQTVAMNGGDAKILYYLAPGPNTRGSGYGDGGYGLGGYGLGVTPPVATGTPITAIDYTLDNFGGTLVASPASGPIFAWQPQGGLYTAQIIANAPIANTGIFVSYAAQIIMAYGSSVLGVQDPLLIRWCDSGNYTSWTASTQNAAGSYRLPRGSKIIGGLQGPLFDLFWTDLEIWSATYIGQPFIYGFASLASGCGLASKFAAGVLLNTVYWMSYTPPSQSSATGSGQFYALPSGGGVAPVACPIWDWLFDQIAIVDIANVRCGVNSVFGEITWFFPRTADGTGKNTAYAKFTPALNAWDYGLMDRSAWIDQSVFGPPIGADSVTNLIFQHEVSNDADGQAMGESFTTGVWSLAEGEEQMVVDLVIPDMKFGLLGQAQTAQVEIAFTSYDYPTGAPVYTTPAYTMSLNGPPFLTPRFRGRLVSMSVGQSNQGSFWRLGGPRMRIAPDGKL